MKPEAGSLKRSKKKKKNHKFLIRLTKTERKEAHKLLM